MNLQEPFAVLKPDSSVETVDVAQSARMLLITPGEGTENLAEYELP